MLAATRKLLPYVEDYVTDEDRAAAWAEVAAAERVIELTENWLDLNYLNGGYSFDDIDDDLLLADVAIAVHDLAALKEQKA